MGFLTSATMGNFDPETLPTLGIATSSPQLPDWLQRLDEIRRNKGIAGDVGGLHYKIGSSDLQGSGKINNAIVKALIGYDGHANLNAEMPMLGGTGQLTYDHKPGNDAYRFQYQRRF